MQANTFNSQYGVWTTNRYLPLQQSTANHWEQIRREDLYGKGAPLSSKISPSGSSSTFYGYQTLGSLGSAPRGYDWVYGGSSYGAVTYKLVPQSNPSYSSKAERDDIINNYKQYGSPSPYSSANSSTSQYGQTSLGNFSAGKFQAPSTVNLSLASSQGSKSLAGGTGDDNLLGGAGNDTLTGGAGNDAFSVDAGIDTVTDLSSGDALIVSAGTTANATVSGGFIATAATRNDGTANLSSAGNAVNLALARGTKGYAVTNTGAAAGFKGSSFNDTLTGGSGNDSLWGGTGIDTLSGGAGNDNLWGEDGDDSLQGNAGDDTLNGGTGIDTLWGDAGDDELWGGDGNDNLIGGSGIDILTGSNGSDTFQFAAGDALIFGTSSLRFERITDFTIGGANGDGLDGVNAVSAANLRKLGSVWDLTVSSLTNILTTTNFSANGASVFTLGSYSYGSAAGLRTFVALNDGTAGFQASKDNIVEITGYRGTLGNLQIV